jgi:hypothetical protein
LSNSTIRFLVEYGDAEINNQIIQQALVCCKVLSYSYAQTINTKLAMIAGSDNETIQKIYAFNKQQKIKNYWPGYKGLIIFLAIVLFFVINIISENNSSSSTQNTTDFNRPQSGNLYPNDSMLQVDSNHYSSNYNNSSLTKKIQNYSDWDSTDYQTGSSPGCYNFIPRYNKSINNKLEIIVGYNTDAAVKLINTKTNNCIRYVYIRSGDTYNIRNIPEGKYYLKIAYGNDWRQKIFSGKCVGKFVLNSLYKKGDEILDFNKVYYGVKKENDRSYNTFQIPSFSLKLDMIATDSSDEFKTNLISESDFNN